MIHRALLAALTVGLAASFLASDAEANHDRRYPGYYPGPFFLPPPPPRYYRYYDEPEYDAYNPYYDPQARKKLLKKKAAKNAKKKASASKKAAKAKVQAAKKSKPFKTAAQSPAISPELEAKPVVAVKPEAKAVVAAKPEAKAVVAATPEANTPLAAKPKAARTAKGSLSCEKAETIISGYGFTGVKASSCEGKVYAFDAARDGKTYAIKLDAASGELTEVRKVR